MAISPADKAESIADCWEEQFQLNNMSDDISDNYAISENNKYFNNPFNSDTYHNISADDIVEFIKTLNPKKAAANLMGRFPIEVPGYSYCLRATVSRQVGYTSIQPPTPPNHPLGFGNLTMQSSRD
ncbi:hypothetical protein CDAR_516391 [Caerostris darwini]|uniref:Uncharacterized protein n=1 Tax=Caerostris darwini TaxID=1538125 RepID=A0AAV4U8U0_9ARAC|nr:hypothetical protein CDAR_516391 [Caerostris darwini]